MQTFILSLLPVVALSACPGSKIPESEVQTFLSEHNKLRSSISNGQYEAKGKTMPRAKTPIPNLTWDCDLEASAQKWADNCQFQHTAFDGDHGENLFKSWSSEPAKLEGNAKAACDNWEGEFQEKGFPAPKMSDYLSPGIGHATQMAWAKTTKIGCGMTKCGGDKEVLVVCQYRAPGNYRNEPVYDA